MYERMPPPREHIPGATIERFLSHGFHTGRVAPLLPMPLVEPTLPPTPPPWTTTLPPASPWHPLWCWRPALGVDTPARCARHEAVKHPEQGARLPNERPRSRARRAPVISGRSGHEHAKTKTALESMEFTCRRRCEQGAVRGPIS